jgi:hypothetical protein
VRWVTTTGPGWRLTGTTQDFLRGSWWAERELTDHRSGQPGSFLGMATFTVEGTDPRMSPAVDRGMLAYHERGELRFGNHHGPASRSLLYRPRPDGSSDVLFADGRPFYLLDLRTGYWQAEHPCGADHYLVTVRVLGADSLTEQWRARGPAKDYSMTTILTRIGRAEVTPGIGGAEVTHGSAGRVTPGTGEAG